MLTLELKFKAMDIKIHSINFDASDKLQEFIESKISKLSQFSDEILGAEVFLRLDKAQNLENKVSKIKLDIPGTDLFAESQARSFEQATDDVVEALRRQLNKRKEKIRGV